MPGLLKSGIPAAVCVCVCVCVCVVCMEVEGFQFHPCGPLLPVEMPAPVITIILHSVKIELLVNFDL